MGSISHPSRAPLSRYSCILANKRVRLSVGERNSMTKSGHRGRNFSFCSGVNVIRRSCRIHAPSGERSAPLGSLNPAEESVTTPLPSCRWHNDKLFPSSALNSQVSVDLAECKKLIVSQFEHRPQIDDERRTVIEDLSVVMVSRSSHTVFLSPSEIEVLLQLSNTCFAASSTNASPSLNDGGETRSGKTSAAGSLG